LELREKEKDVTYRTQTNSSAGGRENRHAGRQIDVQGPKGKLSFAIPNGITFEQKDGILTAKRATEEHRALHGLARALVANAFMASPPASRKSWTSWASGTARS